MFGLSAKRLVAAIEEQVGPHRPVLQLRWATATSPEVVEVVYSDPASDELRGMRISLALVRSAPERIRQSSIEELAFDIVTTGVFEPRPPEDFLLPDHAGIRWLSMDRWIEEVS